jgi:hypothetical protein
MFDVCHDWLHRTLSAGDDSKYDYFNLQVLLMGAERKSAQFYVRLFALKIAPGLLALIKVLPYHSANKVTSSRVIRMYNLGRGLEVDRVSFWRWLLILTEVRKRNRFGDSESAKRPFRLAFIWAASRTEKLT